MLTEYINGETSGLQIRIQNLVKHQDRAFCENSFHKALHILCLTGFWIRHWAAKTNWFQRIPRICRLKNWFTQCTRFKFHMSQSNILRGKCANMFFVWSAFSHIQAEYGDLVRKSSYPGRIGQFSRSDKSSFLKLHS